MAMQVTTRAKDLYEEDFYVWVQDQAALLRAGRFDALDLDNLIEEVEGLADVKRSAVLNDARVIMEHLLKLQHSPAGPSRRGPRDDPRNKWRASVREHRSRLEADLTPRLRQVLADELGRWYARARHDAAGSLRDHGEEAAADALPETCPYTLEQITGDWLP